MSLDVFDPGPALQNAQQNLARDLPAGFGEALDVAWNYNTQWHNSAASFMARNAALAEFNDGVFRRTGARLPTIGFGEGDVSLDEYNAALAKVAPSDPENGLQPLSEASIEAMTQRRMRKVYEDNKAFDQRETTWGGTLGSVVGALGGTLMDPVQVALLPLGGAGTLPIALRALEFAAIGGGTEAAIAASNYQAREAAVPGSSKEIPGEIAGATLFGGVLGGAIGALGKVLGHGARPLPTSVRDEVNAATSELQFHATNPFPTAAGEAAARDATVEATTSLVRGEPVRAAENFAAVHVADLASAAKVATPEELAIAGEKHLRPGTFDERPNVEVFDRMPGPAEDTASYWDRRLAEASPEERVALGATDEAGALPRTGESGNVTAARSDVIARDLTPEQLQRLAADPATEQAVLRNLDRIRVENPEAEFTTQVRQSDGTYQFVSRKLEDVMDELDGLEALGKELEACAVGMAAE